MVLRQLVKKSIVIGFINGCCLIDSYMDGEAAFVDIFQVCCQEHTVPITCHLSVLRGFCSVICTVPRRGCGLLYREGDFAFPPPLQMPKTSDLLHHCFYFFYFSFFSEGTRKSQWIPSHAVSVLSQLLSDSALK